jgi:hypothetical protein
VEPAKPLNEQPRPLVRQEFCAVEPGRVDVAPVNPGGAPIEPKSDGTAC